MQHAPKSEHRGVRWSKQQQRWIAQITVDGRRYHLGLFESERDGARAHDRAALALIGASAPRNFPDDPTLHPATPDELAAERRSERKPSSQFRGVCALGDGKWRASVAAKGTAHAIKTFENETDAALAYDRLALHYLGPGAKLNFPRRRARPASTEELRREILEASKTKNAGVALRGRSGGYLARINVEGTRHGLGIWSTEREAAIARDRAVLHFGLDVPLNWPAASTKLGPLSPDRLRLEASRATREKNCESRYFGVMWNGTRAAWAAAIQLEGKWKIIRCMSEEQAATIHDRLVLHYAPDNARRNFPEKRLTPASVEEIRRELLRIRKRDTTSRYVGVWRDDATGRWSAAIKVGRIHPLGSWRSERDAAMAYDRAALYFAAGVARNFPKLDLTPASPDALRAEQRAQTKATRTSQFFGVSWIDRMQHWRADVLVRGRRYILGCFDDEEEAARAYDRVARAKHGAHAKLNFPTEALAPASIDQVREEKHAAFKETTTSRYTGVSWHEGSQRWRAAIKVDGVTHRLGDYHDEVEAARAYDRAALRLRGREGYLNFSKRRAVEERWPPQERTSTRRTRGRARRGRTRTGA